MNKTLFSVGALVAGCFTLTACSGGAEGNSENNVGVLSGRTIVLESPGNMVGSMFIDVRERISNSNKCNAVFSFGSSGADSSRGTVTIISSKKGDNGWEKCEFDFHIWESEISESVEFKAFFGGIMEFSSAGNDSNSNDSGNNGGDDNDDNQGSVGGSDVGAEDYIIAVEPVRIKCTFSGKGSSSGSFVAEPTTVYLDETERPAQTKRFDGEFVIFD